MKKNIKPIIGLIIMTPFIVAAAVFIIGGMCVTALGYLIKGEDIIDAIKDAKSDVMDFCNLSEW